MRKNTQIRVSKHILKTERKHLLIYLIRPEKYSTKNLITIPDLFTREGSIAESPTEPENEIPAERYTTEATDRDEHSGRKTNRRTLSSLERRNTLIH